MALPLDQAIAQGSEFAFFSMLPTELRREIWHLGFKRPRIHKIYRGLSNGKGSSALTHTRFIRYSPVGEACEEAHVAGFDLEQGFFETSEPAMEQSEGNSTSFTYVNDILETLWFPDGAQRVNRVFPPEPCWGFFFRELGLIAKKVTRLALPVSIWSRFSPSSRDDNERHHPLIWSLGWFLHAISTAWNTEELIIVVGSYKSHPSRDDDVFVEPMNQPDQLINEGDWSRRFLLAHATNPNTMPTWEDLESGANKTILRARRDRMDYRDICLNDCK